MKMNVLNKLNIGLWAMALTPSAAFGCACGCGVFDVATESMLPTGPGGMLWVEFNYMDQNMNWSNGRPAPAANNGDADIRTYFTTYTFQYMFNRDWGIQAELPYDWRHYAAYQGGATTWSAFGDLRVEGIYTGFLPDMSAGVTLGLKLPTGDDTHDDATPTSLLDRDTELGSGSTDILLGGFYRHPLNSVAHGLYWFAQAELDVPVLIQGGYRPGVEIDSALGLYYSRFKMGKLRITPVAQAIPSERTSDTGAWASGGVNDPPVGIRNSGYQRVLLSPGIEFDVHPLTIYADVEFDVLQFSRGNQLVAPELFKVVISYNF
jgi:hypothetical protein